MTTASQLPFPRLLKDLREIRSSTLTADFTFAFHLLLCASLVLYVYRFYLIGANISLFRAILVAWTAVTLWRLARRPVTALFPYVPFLALCAILSIINAIDFVTLGAHASLRRDVVNHLANVCFAVLVVLHLRTEKRIESVLQAFVLSSFLTTGITFFQYVYGRLPFESWIRGAASESSRNLRYILDDGVFRRATSTFYDPNFYGMYSVWVLCCTIYLWSYVKPRRVLAVAFVLNLVCLSLTLSRTALVGLLLALAVWAVSGLGPRRKLFSAAVAVVTPLLFVVATLAQNPENRRSLERRAPPWIAAAVPKPAAPKPAAAKPAAAKPAAAKPAAAKPGALKPAARKATTSKAPGTGNLTMKPVAERLAETTRLRIEFARNGVGVFLAHPLVGAGSAGLLRPRSPFSTAHLTYLTLLARYGILGAAPYVIFMVYPLVRLWRQPRGRLKYRTLVSMVLFPLLVMYLSYDVFFFFEVQYLFYGLAYAIALGATNGVPSPESLSIAESLRSKIQGIREIWSFDNRWHLLVSRILFARDPISVYRIGSLDVLIDHSAGDANGARNVLASPMYREHLRRIDRHAPLTVLDIGANGGGFPLLMRLEGLPIAKVVGVELNPRTCDRLRFNLARNLDCEHRVINAALCGHARTLELQLGAGSVADSIYRPSHNAKGTAVRVSGMTLDEIYEASFAGEIVDICKMDVEEAEYEVFDCPEHDRIERCRYLIIEIHDRPGRRSDEVVQAIVKHGFVELPPGSDPSVHSFANPRLPAHALRDVLDPASPPTRPPARRESSST